MKPKSEKPKRRNNSYHVNKMEIAEFVTSQNSVVEYLVDFLKDVQNTLTSVVYSEAARTKDTKTIYTRFASEGLSFATQTLPKLSEGLFHYFETGHVSYPSFQLDKSGVHPLFLSRLFSLACSSDPLKVTAIGLIYQLSVMFSKLKGPYPLSVLGKQLADFVEVDQSFDMGKILSNPKAMEILMQARKDVTLLFKNNNVLSGSKPRPGPGATNTPVAKHLRYRPKVLYTQVDDVMDYRDYFLMSPWDTVDQSKYWTNLYKTKVRTPTSRHKFVHKKSGKARGICIEENEIQFMQQALRHSLYDWIEHHPLTKGKVCFTDQSVNKGLALASSWTGLYATLDESEASDRVFRFIVLWLFAEVDFVDELMALSTRVIEFPKEFNVPDLRTKKFAPMGSALCFPIMAVVHWALLRSIIKMQTQVSQEEVYVYGDDIILPIAAVDAVLEHLPVFGMKLNKSKSFWRSGFRESCGTHAYNGVDITPVYVKHIPVTTSVTFAMSCISSEQQFFSAGHLNVARRFRMSLNRLFGDLPITSMTSGVFGFKRHGNFFPITTGVVREKRDEYGDILFRFRMVSAVQNTESPPSEYECYLRHALVQSTSNELKSPPKLFKTNWQYVAWAMASGYPNILDRHTTRFDKDKSIILKEQCYDYYSLHQSLYVLPSNHSPELYSYTGYGREEGARTRFSDYMSCLSWQENPRSSSTCTLPNEYVWSFRYIGIDYVPLGCQGLLRYQSKKRDRFTNRDLTGQR